VDVLRCGVRTIQPRQDLPAKLSEWGKARPKPWGDKQWESLLRMLERTDPSFKS
jgi:hypothetical protein